MTSFHVYTLTTPFGRVTYAHHALDRLNDGAEGFITDATLDPEDGSEPTTLALDEVVSYIRRFGPAAVVWPPARIETKRLD
jgi:hypothetical protein